MKKILTLTLTLVLTFSLSAQTYDFIDSDWRRLGKDERGLSFSPNQVKAFMPSGEAVPFQDVIGYLMNIDYSYGLYVDSENNPVALVFEAATEEEKAAKIKMYENFKGSDFMMKEQAPDFSLKDLEGDEFTLSEFEGEYVMLNFWFVGCKPCIMEIPELNELVEEFESKGIHFVAVGLDNADKTDNFLKTKMPFNYRLLPNGRKVSKLYGVTSYPTHLLLDKKGKVIFSQQGYFPGLKHALRKRLLDAAED